MPRRRQRRTRLPPRRQSRPPRASPRHPRNPRSCVRARVPGARHTPVRQDGHSDPAPRLPAAATAHRGGTRGRRGARGHRCHRGARGATAAHRGGTARLLRAHPTERTRSASARRCRVPRRSDDSRSGRPSRPLRAREGPHRLRAARAGTAPRPAGGGSGGRPFRRRVRRAAAVPAPHRWPHASRHGPGEAGRGQETRRRGGKKFFTKGKKRPDWLKRKHAEPEEKSLSVKKKTVHHGATRCRRRSPSSRRSPCPTSRSKMNLKGSDLIPSSWAWG